MSLKPTRFQLSHIERKLELWSEYIITGGAKGLGSVPVYMKVGHSDYQSSIELPVTYDEYNQINQAITDLPEILQTVIYLEWCQKGTRESKAKKAGITSTTYRNRLKWGYTELSKSGL